MLTLVRDDSVYVLFKTIQMHSVENGEATKYVWSENYLAVTKDYNYYMSLTESVADVAVKKLISVNERPRYIV